MDVLRNEISSIYEAQNLASEALDQTVAAKCRAMVEASVKVSNDCRVITDASADKCWIFNGAFAKVIGLSDSDCKLQNEVNSSDEDVIYNRIHPEDLVDKRMLEYEFFKYIDRLPCKEKLNYKATCRLRIRNRLGQYIFVDNSTRILQQSPSGKIWLILCCYDLAACQETGHDISPQFINIMTGDIKPLQLTEKRNHILTNREKEILNLIKIGKPSKQIADTLGISIHTVNRHRQNILEKLSVGNSLEAVMAADEMKLL